MENIYFIGWKCTFGPCGPDSPGTPEDPWKLQIIREESLEQVVQALQQFYGQMNQTPVMFL